MPSSLTEKTGYAEHSLRQNVKMQKIFALALSIICFLLLVDNAVPVLPLHFDGSLSYYNISLIFCCLFLLNWFVLQLCDQFQSALGIGAWWSILSCVVFIHVISLQELLNGHGLMALALGTITLAVVVSSNYVILSSLVIGSNFYLYFRTTQLPDVNIPTNKMSIVALTMLGVIVFIITERQRRKVFRTRQQLSAKVEELNEAIDVKSIFFEHMSHELRTPLNSLLLLSQNLQKNDAENLTEQQVKQISVIHNSGSELLRMVNGLLDLSKVDANKMLVNNDEISFLELSDYMHNLFQPLMDEANLNFTVAIDDQLPDTFVSDQQHLFQIIKNLVSNALKFTEKGEVVVDIKQNISSENGEEQIKISVSDTGIGINENMQQEIFDEFSQAGRNIAREYGGTGLGLAISKKLAKLLDGTITLNSRLNSGSTFNLFLPLITTSAYDDVEDMIITRASILKAKEKNDLNDDDRALKSKTILLVDDDKRNIYALSEVLNSYGIRSIIAENGVEALKLLKKHNEIDLVLMDMLMPGMDGEDAISRIRFTVRGEHLPIISITANAMPHYRQKCLDAGANDYLAKPIDIEILLSKMSNLL